MTSFTYRLTYFYLAGYISPLTIAYIADARSIAAFLAHSLLALVSYTGWDLHPLHYSSTPSLNQPAFKRFCCSNSVQSGESKLAHF